MLNPIENAGKIEIYLQIVFNISFHPKIAEDLAAQTEILYGTLDSGSTMTFFRVIEYFFSF